jgi:DNA repair exonuclease SbcCD ATPase subunit
MSQQITAAKKVTNLTQNLNASMAKRAELQEQLDGVNAAIKAIREALQGVQIGQALEQEIMLERAAKLAADREADSKLHRASIAQADKLAGGPRGCQPPVEDISN